MSEKRPRWPIISEKIGDPPLSTGQIIALNVLMGIITVMVVSVRAILWIVDGPARIAGRIKARRELREDSGYLWNLTLFFGSSTAPGFGCR